MVILVGMGKEIWQIDEFIETFNENEAIKFIHEILELNVGWCTENN